jgi:hypothetical protein
MIKIIFFFKNIFKIQKQNINSNLNLYPKYLSNHNNTKIEVTYKT